MDRGCRVLLPMCAPACSDDDILKRLEETRMQMVTASSARFFGIAYFAF